MFAVVGGRPFPCSKFEQQLLCPFDLQDVTLLGRAGSSAPNVTNAEDAAFHLLDLERAAAAVPPSASSTSRSAHVRRRRFLSSSEPSVYDVYVLVGQRAPGAGLRQLVGQVQFEQTPSTSRLFMAPFVASSSFIIIVVLVALMVLAGVSFVVIFLLVRHKREHKALVQRTKFERDQWEEQMRLLCRDTLEANNTNLLLEVTHGPGVEIPFRDYKSFCMRILFPDLCAVPVPPSGANGRSPPGLLSMYSSGTSASLSPYATLQNDLNNHPVLRPLKERVSAAHCSVFCVHFHHVLCSNARG